jgi:hypothetical protein
MPTPERHYPALDLYTCSASDNQHRPIATFLLPAFSKPISEITAGTDYLSLDLDTNLADMRNWGLFYPRFRSKPLLVFILGLEVDGIPHQCVYEIQIPFSALTSHLDVDSSNISASDSPVIVPWIVLRNKGAAIRPATDLPPLKTTPNAQWYSIARIMSSQLFHQMQLVDYDPLRVARARHDGIPEMRMAPQSSRLCPSLFQGGSKNPFSAVIDARHAPSSLFSAEGEDGGTPIPRLVLWRNAPDNWSNRLLSSQASTDAFFTVEVRRYLLCSALFQC